MRRNSDKPKSNGSEKKLEIIHIGSYLIKSLYRGRMRDASIFLLPLNSHAHSNALIIITKFESHTV